MTHHQPVCSRHIAETAPGEATTEDHPNPRLRKGFKPRNTRNTRKIATLPRISRIPRSSRLSILATCLNPQHFAPSCRGRPPLGEDSGHSNSHLREGRAGPLVQVHFCQERL